MASPAVGEIFGNGIPYVVVSYGGLTTQSCDGGIIALKGTDGSKEWQFSTKSFNRKAHEWAMHFGVISTPALADTDGDGKMEIGFGALDRHVYLLNSDGSVRWYYLAADTVFSSAAFADIDDDPDLEMLIGTDISQNTRINPPTKNGGFVYAFRTGARKSMRISFRDPAAYVWKTFLPQVIQGGPVVGDLIPARKGNEVVVSSGCFFPQRGKKKTGRWLKVLSAETGRVLNTLKAPSCFSSSPALADIDEDGQTEVVAAVNGLSSYGGDGKGRLIAWKADRSDPIWSVIPRTAGSNEKFMGTYISPVVADLDGNGSLEVLVVSGAGISIFTGRNGTSLSCQERGCVDIPFRLYTWATLKNTPAIGDVNADGIPDVIAAGTNGSSSRNGFLFAWTSFEGLLGSSAGAHPPFSVPWPMHRGNAQRTGN